MPEGAMRRYFSYAAVVGTLFQSTPRAARAGLGRRAAAWRRADVADPSIWRAALTPDRSTSCARAVAHARGTGRELGDLRATDFPLPSSRARWRAGARRSRPAAASR